MTKFDVQVQCEEYYTNPMEGIEMVEPKHGCGTNDNGEVVRVYTTVQSVVDDYALTAGTLAIDGERVYTPMEYLEEAFDAVEQINKGICIEFLKMYYSEESIAAWVSEIAWEEDEDL